MYQPPPRSVVERHLREPGYDGAGGPSPSPSLGRNNDHDTSDRYGDGRDSFYLGYSQPQADAWETCKWSFSRSSGRD
jgi:hypothetical protein